MRKLFYFISCLICLHLLSTDAGAQIQYKVKKGETLYRIAKSHGISVVEMKRVNGLSGNNIQIGDVLRIPEKVTGRNLKKSSKTSSAKSSENNTKKSENNKKDERGNLTTHIVERGETLYRISLRFGLSVKELKRINNLSGNKIRAGRPILVPSVENEEEVPDAIEESVDGVEVVDVNIGADPQEGNETAVDKSLANHNEDQVTEPEKEEDWLSLIDVAMEYIGIPYRFGGTSLRGIDCSAFVQMVYRYFSIELPRTAREQFKAGVKVSRKELQIGDLIFFRTYARYPSHVGIYIGEGKMIHASSRNRKVTITSINEPYYVRRYIGAVRLPENPSLVSTEDNIKSLSN